MKLMKLMRLFTRQSHPTTENTTAYPGWMHFRWLCAIIKSQISITRSTCTTWRVCKAQNVLKSDVHTPENVNSKLSSAVLIHEFSRLCAHYTMNSQNGGQQHDWLILPLQTVYIWKFLFNVISIILSFSGLNILKWHFLILQNSLYYL